VYEEAVNPESAKDSGRYPSAIRPEFPLGQFSPSPRNATLVF
jgi:hypothetical protein